ncbi:DUF4293 domain-containing protein [Danxiaibacter flavus]|uniref:DUF4293 domain-containing protein n=1 Tax=Danxiaibacter flavus TaxID=3049108 RepID=A0ABV3ZCF1_9BACT|nr:DUF4293 domain-containing protein [Chitinophagaceae bacterium DXS]
MIQRAQSLWLLAASICGFISLRTTFFNGTTGPFTGTTNVFILILTVICATISLVDIFLFKNRKLQLRIALINALISALVIFLYLNTVSKLVQPGTSVVAGLSILSILVFVIPVFLLFAARGIYKDEKLVKSVNRLRN